MTTLFTLPSDGLRAMFRDLADRAASLRVEQSAVPPSRVDMAIRKDRRSAVQVLKLARQTFGQGYDRRFP